MLAWSRNDNAPHACGAADPLRDWHASVLYLQLSWHVLVITQ
jgi:hypothetical protein